MEDSSFCNQPRMCPFHDQLWALVQALLGHGDKLLQTCNHSWEAMLVELSGIKAPCTLGA